MEKLRNPFTQERKTVYVVPTPDIKLGTAFSRTLNGWTLPFVLQAPLKGGCDAPKANYIRNYLEAFYHPIPIRMLSNMASFVPWTEGKAKPNPKEPPQYIGLQMGDNVTRITTRPCPDETYPRQLNLNDMLDAAIEALPSDAYALVLLTDHDLYEDDDDDFCCGRAYGNSRVAVVSSARYHPLLDKPTGIDRAHTWPFSHCAAYVQRLCRDADGELEAAGSSTSGTSSSKRRKLTTPSRGPDPKAPVPEAEQTMMRVIQAGLGGFGPNHSPTAMWLARMVRTVVHELGHCLCLDHCSYYACVMQGTAGMAEDLRQPPYLCLVCEAKLARAVRDIGDEVGDEGQVLLERYERLVRFCDFSTLWKSVGMFAAYKGWLEERIVVLKEGSS
jgi:archaemetzincin